MDNSEVTHIFKLGSTVGTKRAHHWEEVVKGESVLMLLVDFLLTSRIILFSPFDHCTPPWKCGVSLAMLQPGVQYLIHLKCQPWVLVVGSVAMLGKTSCIITPTEEEFAWPPLPSAKFTYTFRCVGLCQFDYYPQRRQATVLCHNVPLV